MIMKKILKLILIALMIVVVIFAVTIVKGIFSFTSNDDEDDFSADDLSYDNEIKKVNEDEILFLLTGVDDNGAEYGTRTDTMMLVKANKDTKTVDIISIPRDTRCYVDGSLDKINAAHSYGGIDLTISTIRDFLGIDLDYYVKVSFDSVVDTIDAMGGVDIDVSEDIANAMEIEPGVHTFNGKQALDYVRFRKGYANADLGRISTQQDFIKQVLVQAMSPKKFLKWPKIFDTLSSGMSTNIPKSEILSFAFAFRNLESENMNSYTLPGEGEYIDGVSYFVAYPEETMELRDEILYDYVILN